MTTPGNQELLELIQVLEEKLSAAQSQINTLRAQVDRVDSDLDDIDSRTNNLIEGVVLRAGFNESLFILKRIGALNDVDIRLGLI